MICISLWPDMLGYPPLLHLCYYPKKEYYTQQAEVLIHHSLNTFLLYHKYDQFYGPIKVLQLHVHVVISCSLLSYLHLRRVSFSGDLLYSHNEVDYYKSK